MIFLLKHNKWVPTSVIPVEEKLMSYETWPDIILSITLQEFTFK